MKIHMQYFDMLDGKYRVAAQLGYNLVTTHKGNRIARTQVKRQYKEMQSLEVARLRTK